MPFAHANWLFSRTAQGLCLPHLISKHVRNQVEMTTGTSIASTHSMLTGVLAKTGLVT